MKRRTWLLALLAFIIFVGVLIGGGSYYLAQMKESLWTQSVSNVLEVTAQGANAFEAYLEQGLFMLEGRANNFAQYESTDTESIGAQLDKYGDGDPTFVVFDLTHGKLYFNSSNSVDISTGDIEKYLSLSDKGYLEPYHNEYTGQRMVGYYERFSFADGAQGLVRKGVLLSEVTERFSLSFYDGAGFSYVINSAGDIMLRSANKRTNKTFLNIFDVAALGDNSIEDVNSFRAHIGNGRKGVVRLNFNGGEYILAFVPVSETEGWYLIAVIPNDVIMEHANRTLMASQVFAIVMAATIIVFAAFVGVVMLYRRRIRSQESEMHYQEQMFSILANNTDDVFLMLSARCDRVEYISPNVERVVGVPQKAVANDLSCFRRVVHAEDGFDNDSIMTIPLGESALFEGEYIHSTSGDRHWYKEKIYHTTIDALERFIVVLADFTEDRKKEEMLSEALNIAEIANKSKSTFLSNMSHDIRTPMNAIVGLATLIQRDAESPDRVREHTKKITASSQHLLGLINDVLDMSKIESGKTTLNIVEFSLAELVDEMATITRLQAKSKKQSFEVLTEDMKNEMLLGDKLRINQVLLNILSNAVKYTPDEGSITMKVSQIKESENGIAHIRFEVADNGIGMSEEYQQQIFHPFTRESRVIVDQTQGTGLGMAITKSLVDLMGGTISVKSKLGEGTCFVVDLNLRTVDLKEDTDFWKDNGIFNTLIVDDDVSVCSGILSAMSGTGVAMQFALNGPTAISMTELAHQNGRDFDLVLIDWKMPGMDGISTARHIKEIMTEKTQIMILTSYDYDEVKDEALDAGINGFLSKPFFVSSFKEAIRNLQSSDKNDTAEENTVGENSLRGCHILCAEDNELNAEILTELLDMEGISCELAENGREAVEKFAAADAGTFDFILMDIQMPVMNGYDATRAIRALERPDTAEIPIIAMTANAFADDIQAALDSGMNAHVAKPVDMAKLLKTLDELRTKQ